MSVNFLLILLSVLELNLPETLVIGCSATLVQCLADRARRSSHQDRVQRLRHDGERRRFVVLRLSRLQRMLARAHCRC